MKTLPHRIAGAFAGLLVAAAPALAAEPVTTFSTDAAYADVVQDLEDAIVNRGYVVDYHGRVGEMLQRTAADVGASRPLYREADFMHFCSAVMSRAAMEQDVANIAFCPWVLFAYEAEETPGTVVVGFRRLPDGPGRDEVNALLEEIVREAAAVE